ncbi:transposase, partial [Mycobacterium tuberculosis]
STSTAATSRRSNSRLPTTLNARDQPPAEVSDQRVSGLTGAVHYRMNRHIVTHRWLSTPDF